MPPYFVDRPPVGALDGQGLIASTLAGLGNGPIDLRFHQVLTAAPAMGKTAFARHLATRVSVELGWVSAVYHCPPRGASLSTLARQLCAACSDHPVLARQPAVPEARVRPDPRALTGHPVFRGHPLAPPRCATSAVDLFEALAWAGRQVAKARQGLLVVVDDCQRLDQVALEALACLACELRQSALPVALLLTVAATSGRAVQALSDRRAPLWHEALGALSADESAQALVVPACRRGVTFETGALDAVHEVAAGCPLAVQKAGFAVWSAAGAGNRITVAGARRALQLVAESTELKAS